MAYYWVPARGGEIPANAFIGGNENHSQGEMKLFVARAVNPEDGIMTPGKAGYHLGDGCHYSYGGKEKASMDYEVLVVDPNSTAKFEWMKASCGRVPMKEKAICTHKGFPEYYVARAHYKGTLTPGKLHMDNSSGCAHFPCDWEEHLAKEYEILVCVDTKEYNWVPAKGGEIPANAFIGGKENQSQHEMPLFVARAVNPEDGIMTPGKAGYHLGDGCHYSYGGKEKTSMDYEILVVNPKSTATFEWIKASGGRVPMKEKAICAHKGDPEYYVARAHYKGTLTPGKLHVDNSSGCAHFPCDWEEHLAKQYEILVCTDTN